MVFTPLPTSLVFQQGKVGREVGECHLIEEEVRSCPPSPTPTPTPGLEIVEVACLKEKDGEACSALMGLASFWGEELRCQPRAGDAGVGFG